LGTVFTGNAHIHVIKKTIKLKFYIKETESSTFAENPNMKHRTQKQPIPKIVKKKLAIISVHM